ncbi:MAG TPA: hypothetical protein VGW40_05080 [Allosphingosinicella sp.]|nr:hypothetical protein [Allosphingosinicella sp.]
MRTSDMVAAYWLPSVGIGPASGPPPVLPGKQNVVVPLTDVLNYCRSDGTPQIDVINLMGCTFNAPDDFANQYLLFDDNLTAALNDGSVARLQAAGISVVLTIIGSGGTSVGWSSVPADQLDGFVDYLNTGILGSDGLNLDGIDVDDEYAIVGDTLPQTLAAMRAAFPAEKIISKALWDDQELIPAIKDSLTFGGIMYYGDFAGGLEQIFDNYVQLGMRPDQMTIGVNAGPVAQGGSFTSIPTVQALTAWQPAGGPKLGMMVWSFSQDIQQFTADPQNQVALAFPNAGDHQWQQVIITAMEGSN